MSEYSSDRPRRSSRSRDQERKTTITSESPHTDNSKPPFTAGSRGQDTKQKRSTSDSGIKNRVNPLPQDTPNDGPAEQRGKRDTVDDEVKPVVAGDGKPRQVHQPKETPDPSLHRAASSKALVTTADDFCTQVSQKDTSNRQQENSIRPCSQPGTRQESILRQSQGRGELDPQNKLAQAWIADIGQCETTLEEMAAASLDQEFMDESSAIKQWLRVLSEAERTAALYAFLQQTTQVQIRFFILVLQQMGKGYQTFSRPWDAIGKLNIDFAGNLPAEVRWGRSPAPAPAEDEEPQQESRGRSLRRSQSTGDRNRSRTRSQSMKRRLVKLFSGENKRDVSLSRVIRPGASILLWEDRSRFASVQLRLDIIKAGSYSGEKIIYLRVSVVVTRGNIENIKHLFINLQMRCPCCKEQWRLVRFSPKTLLGDDIAVDCKDTRADEYGAEAGGTGAGAEAKVTGKRMSGTERQYIHRDRYELKVTDPNNTLTCQMTRVGNTVKTSPPSLFKLQTIAAPPCNSNEMQITADLVLNGSKADGSWRPVPLKGLKDPCNFDDWTEEDWKQHGGCDSFEIK